jgi:hypothetical protein
LIHPGKTELRLRRADIYALLAEVADFSVL